VQGKQSITIQHILLQNLPMLQLDGFFGLTHATFEGDEN
jgi:hypothetical protein